MRTYFFNLQKFHVRVIEELHRLVYLKATPNSMEDGELTAAVDARKPADIACSGPQQMSTQLVQVYARMVL